MQLKMTLKAKNKVWDTCIKKAKLIKPIKTAELFKLVDLAVKACDIYRGGRHINNNKYSITNFAAAIGMNGHTLNEWIRVKVYVFDKLPKDKKLEPMNFYTRLIKGLKSWSTPEEVEKRYDHYKSMNENEFRLRKYFQVFSSIKYNLSRPYNLVGVTPDTINKIKTSCEEILKQIEMNKNA